MRSARTKKLFEREGYRMYFVINAKRPLTATADEAIEYMIDIEKASRLTITDLINNTNLSSETEVSDIVAGDAGCGAGRKEGEAAVHIRRGKAGLVQAIAGRFEGQGVWAFIIFTTILLIFLKRGVFHGKGYVQRG